MHTTRMKLILQIANWLAAASLIIGGCLALASCHSSSGSGAAAAQSVRAGASGPAEQEAETDARQLLDACAPTDPKTGKPVADPMATLLASKAARHVYAGCEKLPRADWPKGISCLITWGGNARRALADIPGYTSQIRGKFAVKVLDYCAAYAKGKPAAKPVFS